MREKSKTSYARSLKNGDLSTKALRAIKAFIELRGMQVEPFTKELLKQYNVANNLSRLDLSICSGHRSWEGLISDPTRATQLFTPRLNL